MFEHVRHVSGMLIVLVFCCTCQSSHGRSATVTSYQHLNGINVRAADVRAQKHIENTDSNSLNEPESAAEQSASGSDSTGIWQDFSLLYRIYKQCANENLSVCLKVKLLTGLEKVLRSSKTLRILEGVQFIRSSENDGAIARNTAAMRPLSEQDIESTLPRSLEAKELVLNNLIFKKLAGFLRDHTLQVKFPDVRSWHEIGDNSIEARGKKKDKKGGGAYIMIPLLLGGTFVPIAYGALAMLAGKALIVSKLALVLASIIGIKKLLSSGGSKEAHEVVVSSGGHSGWGRDMDLAYSDWKPAKETQKVA